MSKAMSTTGLPMFGGGPDNLKSGDEVMVHAVAMADDSNNYHFFPHVVWVEPGTTVKWEHFVKPHVSVARVHTSTALSGKHFGVRLIPESAQGWDSKLMAGTGSMMSSEQRFFDAEENGGITNDIGKQVVNSESNQLRGGFSHTFEKQGVYMYYCQNHYKFNMAGAVVVGPLSGKNKAEGWAPAMTADLSPIEEYVGAEGLIDQLGELREFVEKGGSMGGM
ncbi:MAG: plastocyanin/azurin family copper-binding protein [Salinigranum sp.]